jgi:hypothetical protein
MSEPLHPARGNSRDRLFPILGTLAICIILILAWVYFQPPPPSPNIVITFGGYTNDDFGLRVAAIHFQNLSPSTVFAYSSLLLIKDPADPRGFTQLPGRQIRWHARLRAGESDTLIIPAPATSNRWRISCLCYNDFDTARVLKRYLFGLRQMPFSIDTPWFEPDLSK